MGDIGTGNACNTIAGLQVSDRLYYEEAQKLWASKSKEQENETTNRRFNELWTRIHDIEHLLQAAFRHIEELKK